MEMVIERGEELYLEVYLDVIFLINFIMDFILLTIVMKILKWDCNLFRRLIGAFIGAIGSCILAITPKLNHFLQFGISYILICGIMVFITYRPKKWSLGLKSVFILYITTFFLGGLLNSLYYHSALGYYFHEIIEGRFFPNIKGRQLIILAISGLSGIALFIKSINNLRSKELELYKVDLYFENKCIHLTGLLDTGNCLYDPIYGKPVIIIEYSALKDLLSEEQKKSLSIWLETTKGDFSQVFDITKEKESDYRKINVTMIPFRSIGKKKGLLPAIKINKMVIWKEDEGVTTENVLTGIWTEKMSRNKEYQLILHRDFV